MKPKQRVMEKITAKGWLKTEELKVEEIANWYLTDLVQEGKIERVERGVYRSLKTVHDPFFVFQSQYPVAVFSFANALYFHDLTDSIPHELEVTVYQGYNTHRFSKAVQVHYIKKEWHQLGVETVKTPYGNTVSVTNRERSLCDLLRAHKKVDSEIFIKAFKRYFEHQPDVHRLLMYAKTMKIEQAMRHRIEMLVG